MKKQDKKQIVVGKTKPGNITGRDVAFLASQIGVRLFNPHNPKFID